MKLKLEVAVLGAAAALEGCWPTPPPRLRPENKSVGGAAEVGG